MRRRRRRHHQLGLVFPSVDKNGQHRGGPRPGSGPKPRFLEGNRRLHAHTTRPALDGKNHPVHVTLRVSRTLPSLRTRDLYHCLRLAAQRVAARGHHAFRIVHISIQRDHVHLLVEARDRHALTSMLRSFTISAAKRLNRRLSRSGPVFLDRYHATPITSPTQARNALAYVLCNWRRHREDLRDRRSWRVDPFSSGVAFGGWLELRDSPHGYRPPPTYEALPTARPQTWLLRVGWSRAGTISVYERPGAR